LGFLKKTYRSLADLPFIRENSPGANLLLFLGIIAFLFIFADLHHESISSQDELATLVIIAESNDSEVITGSSYSFIKPVIKFEYLSISDESVISTGSFALHPGRSPPQA
jgi:hypothetical protein